MKAMKDFAEKRKKNPKLVLDLKSMRFRCKSPELFFGPYGDEMVRKYNCETGEYEIYSKKKYIEKFGELE